MDFTESDELTMLREAVASIASKFGHSYYVEKAHADVFNPLLQILEDGRLTDAQGRTTRGIAYPVGTDRQVTLFNFNGMAYQRQ